MYTAVVVIPSILLLSLIYGIHYLSITYKPQFLPVHRLTTPDTTVAAEGGEGGGRAWNLSWSGMAISLWTSNLNTIPQRLLRKLSYRNSNRLKKAYHFSVLLGLVGGAVAVGLALWTTVEVWKEVWREAEQHASVGIATADGAGEGVGALAAALAANVVGLEGVEVASDAEGLKAVKRSLETVGGATAVQVRKFSGMSLKPLIPGFTVPLSHAPTLALAFALNQLLHELGHASSAALDDILPSRFSINLHFFIPSAMVAFPSSIDSLSPSAKMRLAASGPVANLWTWFVLLLLGSSGLGSMFWSNHGADGRVVEAVHWKSPLYDHLIPGDLITHLDDLFLGSLSHARGVPDRWHSYLRSSEVGDADRGWCVVKSTFLDLPPVPCHEGNTTSTSDIAFVSVPRVTEVKEERCLSPHPILDIQSAACPCPDSKWICVRPSESVLRIRVVRGGSEVGQEDVILWRGPREEVVESVVVGKKAAKGWNGGVRWAALFVRYLSTIALSLYLFNLLPLPYTDGAQLLSSLVQWHAENAQPEDKLDGVPMFTATISGEEDIELGLGEVDNLPIASESESSSKRSRGGGGVGQAQDFELDSEEEANYAAARDGGVGTLQPMSGRTIGKSTNSTSITTVKRQRGGNDPGGRSRRGGSRWSRYAQIAVEWSLLAIVLLWIGGWGMLLLLRSS